MIIIFSWRVNSAKNVFFQIFTFFNSPTEQRKQQKNLPRWMQEHTLQHLLLIASSSDEDIKQEIYFFHILESRQMFLIF